MKISEMTTNQAADVLVRIADPAANIMHDAETFSMLESISKSDATNAVTFIADNIVTIARVLLKNHRIDLFEVVAALTDKTVDDVANQKFTQTVKDLKDSWDGELVDFFGSVK